jgi:chemotaxis protein histidine kinase CheA
VARKKEERLQVIMQAKEAKQAKIKAREEEAARKKEESQQKVAREQEKKQAQLRGGQEEKLKREAEIKAKQERLKSKQDEEAAEKRLKTEEERKSREELAKKKEEESAAESLKRQERLEELAQERERKDEEFRVRQEEFLQKQQERLEEVAWNKQQKQAELLVRQQELAQLQTERQLEEADLEAQREEQKQEQRMLMQEQLDNQKQQMQARINEAKKASMQGKDAASLASKNQKAGQLKKEGPARIEEGTQGEYNSLVEPPEIIRKMKATRITMDFDKVGLRSILSFLTEESGINFVASQKVMESEPLTSIRFKDATVGEAIKYIAKNLGLIYRINKELVWVATQAEVSAEPMETRIYYLNKRGIFSTKSGIISLGTLENDNAQMNGIFVIEDTLRELLPWPAESKMYYDKRVNALFVKNTSGNLQMLEEILYNK